ncbi:hypothetical protein ABT298_14785 [Streptomyces sp. NPDC001034]|uniref:hypothetical protein n=1 Tax=Streptomyces sp. NPDC001034 TaxID=3154375 RepID=UPI003324989C
MKKTALIAAPLALAASLALAPAAEAAPTGTPARACFAVVDLKNPPVGTNLDLIYKLARDLGLPEAPTVLGGACDKHIRPDADSGPDQYKYNGSGPVILRRNEGDLYQQYCTNSVSFTGTIGPPVSSTTFNGLITLGSNCIKEVNPIAL